MAPKATTSKPDPDAMAVPKTPRKRGTAMKATTPKKATTPGFPSRLAESDQLLFLWTCLRHKGGEAAVDYGAVAADLGISKNAAYKRWAKLKGVCERLEEADQRDRNVEGQGSKEAGGKGNVEEDVEDE